MARHLLSSSCLQNPKRCKATLARWIERGPKRQRPPKPQHLQKLPNQLHPGAQALQKYRGRLRYTDYIIRLCVLIQWLTTGLNMKVFIFNHRAILDDFSSFLWCLMGNIPLTWGLFSLPLLILTHVHWDVLSIYDIETNKVGCMFLCLW